MRQILGIMMTALAVAGLLAAQPGHAWAQAQPMKPVEEQEIYNYHLSMEKVTAYAKAADGLQKWRDSHPDLKPPADANPNEGVIDGTARLIQEYPDAVEVLRKTGLTPREYVVLSIALVNASMIVGMKEGGQIKDYPPGTISKENAAFMESHRKEMDDLVNKVMKPGQKG